MPIDFAHSASVFMGFLAIMNPIANVPIFLGLTAGYERPVVRAVAIRGIGLAFLLVALFAFVGQAIFDLFGITLPAFRITGGVLVTLIGYRMLHGESSAVHQPSSEDKESAREAALSVAVSPLALPILAGPGTIATAISFASKGGESGPWVTVAAFGVLCLLSLVLFLSGQRLVSFLGQAALGAITRLMGLVLAVIGVQMLIEGITGAIALVTTK